MYLHKNRSPKTHGVNMLLFTTAYPTITMLRLKRTVWRVYIARREIVEFQNRNMNILPTHKNINTYLANRVTGDNDDECFIIARRLGSLARHRARTRITPRINGRRAQCHNS